MQLTLIQVVQDMLAATQSDSITTLSSTDSEDALLCVNIANREYERLIYKYRWFHKRTQEALIAGAYNSNLKGNTGVYHIDLNNVYYEQNRLLYVGPEDFLSRTRARDSAASNVTTINGLYILNDVDPTFFTSFDGVELVFDATESAGAITAADSRAIVYKGPTARLSADANTFDLPMEIFSQFDELCIAKALIEIKGDGQGGLLKQKHAEYEIEKLGKKLKLFEVPATNSPYLSTRSGTYRTRLWYNGNPVN